MTLKVCVFFLSSFLRWWKLVQAALGILVTIAQLVSSSIYLYTEVLCFVIFGNICLSVLFGSRESEREKGQGRI